MRGSRWRVSMARWMVLTLSAVTLVVALYAFSLPVIEVPKARSQFPLLEAWWSLVRLHRLQPIQDWLQCLTLSCVMLASALALVLALSRREDDGLTRLRRALSFGALAALYFVVLRPGLVPGLPWTMLLDPLAFAAGAGGVVDLTAFLAGFPSEVRLELISRYVERRTQMPSRFQTLARWRKKANRMLGSALARLVPSLRSWPQDDEATAERSTRAQHRLLALMRNRGLWLGAVLLGALLGLGFALSAGTALHSLVGLSFVLAVTPIAGFSGIGINYEFGDDEARRRIGWLYVLPTLVFLIGAVAWSAILFLLLLFGFDSGLQIARMSAESLWLASTLLFFPVMVAAILLGIALAVFYQGSLDPRLALRKGSVLGLLGVLLTTLFVAIEGAMSAQIVTRFGWPDETGALIAGTLTALGFSPLRSLVDRRAERLVETLLPARDLADGHRETMTVCFVDMSGYTAMAARDEHSALLLAGVLRKTARDAAEHHGGRLVKTIGDAALLSFPTPPDALAGLEELRLRYRRGTAALEIDTLPLHAGMHHGEVVVGRDGDIYGADVNLAARLQGAASDGELLGSETAVAGLGDRPCEHRHLQLKNIPVPVRAGVIAW